MPRHSSTTLHPRARGGAATSPLLLLASDERLRELQRDFLDRFRDVPLSRADIRREQLEDERELRNHARMRQLGWLVVLGSALLATSLVLAGILIAD